MGSAEFAYAEKPAIFFPRFNCSANAGKSPRVNVSGSLESTERFRIVCDDAATETGAKRKKSTRSNGRHELFCVVLQM